MKNLKIVSDLPTCFLTHGTSRFLRFRLEGFPNAEPNNGALLHIFWKKILWLAQILRSAQDGNSFIF